MAIFVFQSRMASPGPEGRFPPKMKLIGSIHFTNGHAQAHTNAQQETTTYIVHNKPIISIIRF